MILLVGLGNPGAQYAGHRHNIGFMAADAIADRWRFGPQRVKFQGHIREGSLSADKALILKPQTYMNESGRSVAEVAKFYKIPPGDVVVLHDELDLAPGKLRMKTGGGHAGHNGLRSIQAHIGPDFRRIRLGVGHPGDKSLVSGYVLHDFAKAEHVWLEPLIAAIADAAPLLAENEDAKFQSRVAADLQPPRPAKPAPLRAAALADAPGQPKPAAPASPFAALAARFAKGPGA